MSRKSYQKVTLSVELTLPPGAKAKDTPLLVRQSIQHFLHCEEHLPEDAVNVVLMPGLSIEQAIIKIIKRETIYP